MIPLIIPYIKADVKWTVFYHCSSDIEVIYALCCLMDHHQSVTHHYILGELTSRSLPDALKKTCHRHLISPEQRSAPNAYERQVDIRDIEIDWVKYKSKLETICDADLLDWGDLPARYEIPAATIDDIVHIAFIGDGEESSKLLGQLTYRGILPIIVRLPSSWVENHWYSIHSPTWKDDLKSLIIRRYIEAYGPSRIWIWTTPMSTQWTPSDYEKSENMLVDGAIIINDMASYIDEPTLQDMGVPSGTPWKNPSVEPLPPQQRIDIVSGEYRGSADMVFIQSPAAPEIHYEGRWVYRGDISVALIRMYMTTTTAIVNGTRELEKYPRS